MKRKAGLPHKGWKASVKEKFIRSIDPRKGKDMNDSLNTGFTPIPDAATPKLSDEQLKQLLAKNPDLAFVTTDEDEPKAEAPTVH